MKRVPDQVTAAPDQTAHGDHEAKGALFDAIADIAGALSAGRRIEIIDLLAQGERSVGDVAVEIDQSTANASHHLRDLARLGLVRSRRDGTRVYYRLAGDEIEELWSALRRVASTVRADLDRLTSAYVGDQHDMEVIQRGDLAARLAAGEVTLLDVRPSPEYSAGHIPGACSVPIDDLADRISTLPTGRPVVTYCRGPYCVFAPNAVRALRKEGMHAVRLEDGFPEWRRAGFPIAVGHEVGRLPGNPNASVPTR